MEPGEEVRPREEKDRRIVRERERDSEYACVSERATGFSQSKNTSLQCRVFTALFFSHIYFVNYFKTPA